MRLTGHYDSLQGHLLNREDNPRCARSSQGLKEMLEGAILPAVDVILDFHETVTDGKRLNARFDCNFE